MSDGSFLTATHWGTYRAIVKDGVVNKLEAFEEDPDPSPIGAGIVDSLNAPSRILAPAVRESWLINGPGSNQHLRGKEPFVEVSWETVEDLLAKEIVRVREKYGSNAIYAGSYGWASAGRFHHAQSQMKRFLNLTGGFTSSVFTYSFAAAEAMIPHVLGSYREFMNTTTSWTSITNSCELMVAFGGIPLKNGQIDSGGLGAHRQREGIMQAKAAGVEFVNISPLRSDMADEVEATWLPARPNSDVAIMLGIAHTLYIEGLHDQNFLQRYCTGFDQFAEYLNGTSDGIPKTAEWAADISEISADTIKSLARRMAQKRTMISVSWSLTRQAHGEQPFWMAITLAAMLGQIGKPGGGFGFGYSASNSLGADYPLVAGGSVPQGKNEVADFIPVARIAEMLENPGERFEFNGKTLTYPDIKMIWWAGGNPYHHHQDLNRLATAWQKPETIVTNDWCWTAHAKRSDIVLPCTTHLERNDVSLSQRDPYMIKMEKAVDAPGLVKTDHEIFRGISRWMNLEPAFSEGRSEAEWLQHIYAQTKASDGKVGDLASTQVAKANNQAEALHLPDWETFCEIGWHRLETPQEPRVMLKEFVQDPDTNPLSTPSGKIEIFSKTVEEFKYSDCPGHPSWMEPYEWLGDCQQDELHLISNQPAMKLHSQLDQGSASQSGKLNGREPIQMNTSDAAERGLSDGDMVEVYNQRGACLSVVITTDTIRRGVVQMSTGAWWDPDDNGMCIHGNANALTRDIGTSSLGQGPTAHTCLVRVKPFEGVVPKLTAFDPPEIKQPT
jgi:biotin/methionine sulfoxide reductase